MYMYINVSNMYAVVCSCAVCLILMAGSVHSLLILFVAESFVFFFPL